MAVSSTATDYSGLGTGASATYGTGIYANASNQIKVYAGSVLQTLGVNYSLNGLGAAAGVNVVGTFANGAVVYIERVTPITQLVDTQNNETILEDVLDAEFDKLTMIAQELSGKAGRALLFPKGESGQTLPAAAARANLYPVFDAAGNLILSTGAGTDGALRADLANPSNTLVRTKRTSLLTAAEYRTLAAKAADRFDFRDMLGADTTGANSMTTTLAAAAAEAKSSGDVLHIPKGIITLDAVVTVGSGTRIRGVGVVPYTTLADGGSRGAGAWFHLAHSGKGFIAADTGFAAGIEFEGIGTYRDQPAVAPGWTPNAHDFDFDNQGAHLLMRNCCLLNPTKGFLQSSGPAGRTQLERVFGQPFSIGVQCDTSYDGFVINNMRWWPFWSNDAYTKAFTKANRKGIYFRHCDNPYVAGYFNIFSKNGICIGSHPNGTTNSALFINPEHDLFGGIALYYEAGADGAYVKQIGGYSYGEANTGAGVESAANNTKTHLVGHKFAALQNRAILLDTGSNNVAVVDGPEVRDWNVANGGFEAFASANTGNKIYLNGHVIRSGGNGAAITNTNLGGIMSEEFVTQSGLGVTAQTGSITTATASGRFRRRSRSIKADVSVTVTANGTGAGDLRVSLPIASTAGRNTYFTGRNITTGQQVQGIVNSSTATITTPGNAYPIASGQTIEFTVEYECDAL